MDIFLINMGEITSEKELTLVFQGTRSCDGYHMLCFEDIDRCAFLQKNSMKMARRTNTLSRARKFLDVCIKMLRHYHNVLLNKKKRL